MTVVDDSKAAGRLRSNYAVEGALGRGAFGDVLRVRRLDDGHPCACKRVLLGPLDAEMRQKALQEARLLKKLSSPYIVQYLDSFLEGGELYIITELCDAGCLANLIKARADDVAAVVDASARSPGLAEEDVCRIAVQVLLGLDYLHDSRVLHRDVKPANIFLLKSGRALLGDLGVAKELFLSKDQAQTVVGSPAYLAPEVVEAQPYGTGSDLWSFGCVVYEMCCLRRPFEAHNQPALFVKILQCRVPPGPPGYSLRYSADVRSVFSRCLRRMPHKRPSAKELLRTPAMSAAISRLGSSVAQEVTLVPHSLGPRCQHAQRRMSAPGRCESPRGARSHVGQGQADGRSCRAGSGLVVANSQQVRPVAARMLARRASSPATYGSLMSGAARAAALGGNAARAGSGDGADNKARDGSVKRDLGSSPRCSVRAHSAAKVSRRDGNNNMGRHTQRANSGKRLGSRSQSDSKLTDTESARNSPAGTSSRSRCMVSAVGAVGTGSRALDAGKAAPPSPCIASQSCMTPSDASGQDPRMCNAVAVVSTEPGALVDVSELTLRPGASDMEGPAGETDSNDLGMDAQATFAFSDSIADSLACSTLTQVSTELGLSAHVTPPFLERSRSQATAGVSSCARSNVACRWPVSDALVELADRECSAIASHFPEVMCSLRKTGHVQDKTSKAEANEQVDHDASTHRRNSLADVLGFLNADSDACSEMRGRGAAVHLGRNEIGDHVDTLNSAQADLRGESIESCNSASAAGASLAAVLHSLTSSDAAGGCSAFRPSGAGAKQDVKAQVILEEGPTDSSLKSLDMTLLPPAVLCEGGRRWPKPAWMEDCGNRSQKAILAQVDDMPFAAAGFEADVDTDEPDVESRGPSSSSPQGLSDAEEARDPDPAPETAGEPALTAASSVLEALYDPLLDLFYDPLMDKYYERRQPPIEG